MYWRDDALCVDAPETWYPSGGDRAAHVAEAVAICKTCPVLRDCGKPMAGVAVEDCVLRGPDGYCAACYRRLHPSLRRKR